jgi:hypothetical protein
VSAGRNCGQPDLARNASHPPSSGFGLTLLSSSKKIGVFMSLLAKAKLEVAVNDHAERTAAKRTSFLH